MKKKKLLMMIIMMLAAVILAGCGKEKEEEREVVTSSNYIEEQIMLPDEIESIHDLKAMKDDSLWLAGANEGMTTGMIYESKDQGETWELYMDCMEVLQLEDAKILDISMSEEGRIVCKFEYYKVEEQYAIIEKDKSVTPLDIKHQDSEDEWKDLFFSKAGTLMVKFTPTGEVAVVDEATGEIGTRVSGGREYTVSEDDVLYSFSRVEYDVYSLLNNKSVSGSKSFQDLAEHQSEIAENREGYSGFGSYNIDTIRAQDDQEHFYYADDDGVYHYDGELNEKLIEGNRTSLGDSSLYQHFFVVQDEENFFVVMLEDNQPYLLRYQYAPDRVAEVETEMTIYTLVENDYLKRLVTKYQQLHPEVKINLQIGLGEGGATPADAIRNLNTEVLAGNGPDIIMMDGLTADNWIEQELLEDLSDIVADVDKSEGLFRNITESFENNGKIYAVPSRFQYMKILGDEETVKSGNSISTLVTAMQELQKQGSETLVYSSWRFDLKVDLLFQIYMADRMGAGKEIEEQELEEFYEQLGEVLKLRSKKPVVIDESGEEFTPDDELEFYGIDIFPTSLSEVDALKSGKVQMALEYVTTFRDFVGMEKLEGVESEMLGRGESKAFYVQSILAISGKSNEKESAKAFVTYALSEEGQNLYDWRNGIPVNKKSVDKMINDEQLVEAELAGKELTEEEKQTFIAEIEQLDQPVYTDYVLKEMVMEQAEGHLTGRITAKEAAQAANQKIKLFIAE